MKFEPIVKKILNGGMAVSMLCMTFTPLSKMQLEPFDVYAAVREIYQFQQVKQYNNNFSDVGTSQTGSTTVLQRHTNMTSLMANQPQSLILKATSQ